ncbi:hypothetical protein WAF17_06695 [Bernardetia sp. ABR2-2B]|uniref:hypothetical protein n=1 Tax=Bernardetia sp. ABR2-2B TaxID=3127472 RepID=UPI0030D2F905
MNPEEIFNDDFFKQFKTGKDLTNFLTALQKRGIEKMLEGELDAHLEYEKHQKVLHRTNAMDTALRA